MTAKLEPAINPTLEAADAFWAYWKANGETHKHGYYESMWGAINNALRTSGVVMHDYPPSVSPQAPTAAPSPLGDAAAVIAEYDEIVSGRLDPRDAEADFVMRGSDWRTIRPLIRQRPTAAGADWVRAATNMDWQQVVLNGGPPCFHHQDDGRFCGRAQRWEGHDDDHEFVALDNLLNKCLLSAAPALRARLDARGWMGTDATGAVDDSDRPDAGEGLVHYERVDFLDKRIAHGDDFAGDAYVRWVAVGHHPNEAARALGRDGKDKA